MNYYNTLIVDCRASVHQNTETVPGFMPLAAFVRRREQFPEAMADRLVLLVDVDEYYAGMVCGYPSEPTRELRHTNPLGGTRSTRIMQRTSPSFRHRPSRDAIYSLPIS